MSHKSCLCATFIVHRPMTSWTPPSFFLCLQVSLFESIKPLFANKQLLVIANKTDVAPFKDLK